MSEIVIKTEDPAVVKLAGQSSVEIKRNSKGVIEFIVKVYNDDPNEAANEATRIVKALEKKYKNDA